MKLETGKLYRVKGGGYGDRGLLLRMAASAEARLFIGEVFLYLGKDFYHKKSNRIYVITPRGEVASWPTTCLLADDTDFYFEPANTKP